MAGITGLDEFEEFSDSMDTIASKVREAKRKALKDTAKDFKKALTGHIRSSSTVKGGTLNSETSPYSPGGENESSDSNLHISDWAAWEIEVVGDDMAVVFPNPEVHTRASWMEHGTASHGPSGDTPMYFRSGGVTIVVADKPDRNSPFYTPFKQLSALEGQKEALFAYGEPGEVDGVEPQRFFAQAVRDVERGDRLKVNMGKQIDKLFEEQGIVLEGSW